MGPLKYTFCPNFSPFGAFLTELICFSWFWVNRVFAEKLEFLWNFAIKMDAACRFSKFFKFFFQFLLETNKMQYSSKFWAILDILLKSRGYFGLKKGQFQAIFIKGNMLIGRHPSRRKRPQIRQKSKFFNSVKIKMFQRGHSFK